MQDTPTDRLIPLKEICVCPGTKGETKLPIGYNTYRRMELRGDIPPSIEIGGQKFQHESVIDAYIAKQQDKAFVDVEKYGTGVKANG